MSARRWLCTIWDDTPPVFDPEHHLYLKYQREVCPSSLRLHWQTYVEMHDKVRPTGVLKSLQVGKKNKCIVAKDRDACRRYCGKEDSRWEEGDIVGPQEFGTWLELQQGKRTDLEGAVECKTLSEIKEKFPTVYVKYPRGIKELIGEGQHRKTMPRCIVMWGNGSNTGKSSAAQKFCDENKWSVYTKVASDWWNGYEQQQAVIISDFNPNEWGKAFNATWFKQFIDWTPYQVSTKGGIVNFNSHVVIFTTNVDPKDWYPMEKNQTVISRRISAVINFGDEDFAWKKNENVAKELIENEKAQDALYGFEPAQ